MNRYRKLLPLSILFAACASVHAQIAVDMQIKRHNFIRYEPIVATVSVTNLSGRDLTLRDGESQWFGFQVNAGSANDLVPPRNPDYHNEPLEIKAGATVKRAVNLNTLFAMGEFGIYRVRATIYSEDLNKFYTSRMSTLDISDGRVLWRQEVGVPEGLPNAGDVHTVSLLSFQGADKRSLYCRIEDRENSIVYCTHHIGYLIDGEVPSTQLDTANNLYVMNLSGPKIYQLTKIGVNGEFLGQTPYASTKSRPRLRRLENGILQVAGGRREVAQSAKNDLPQPKLSDRPAGLPAN